MDITARESGSFYTPGRTTLIPAGTGGAPGHRRLGRHHADDGAAQLDYAVASELGRQRRLRCTRSTASTTRTPAAPLMPQSVLIFMKPNEGGYSMNIGFARLSYRF